MTEQKRTPTQITDPTGRAVADNVRRLRERRGLSTYDLARKLKEAGRPISASAIAKVERAERRVDVGDLMALTIVLGVNASALLLPLDDSPTSAIEVTGAGSLTADAVWDWTDGRRPLKAAGRDEGEVWLEFQLYGRPSGRRANKGDTAYLYRELRDAGFDFDRFYKNEPTDGD